MSGSLASLSWALISMARRQGVVIDSVRLDGAVAAALQGEEDFDFQRLSASLNIPAPELQQEPQRASLPLLCKAQGQGWGVLVDQRPDGRWAFVSASGQALVSTAEVGDGTYKIDFSGQQDKGVTKGFERIFQEAIAEFRPVIVEVVVASVVMSVIALGASIFSMQVYDRVIPTHGVATLIVLATGVGLAILFELGMKFARSHIMDSVVSGLDAKLSQALFERLLSVRVDQLPGSVGSLPEQSDGEVRVLIDHYCRADVNGREIIRNLASYAGKQRP